LLNAILGRNREKRVRAENTRDDIARFATYRENFESGEAAAAAVNSRNKNAWSRGHRRTNVFSVSFT
jgi:hypothetical protein